MNEKSMEQNSLFCLSWGSGLAGLGVILGAFGAHALKTHGEVSSLMVFETAVRYQMYHAFSLLFLGLLSITAAGQKLADPILLWPAGAPGATGVTDEDKPAIIPF